MKVNLLSLFLFLFGLVKPLKAQDFSFGIKGGLLLPIFGNVLRESNLQNNKVALSKGTAKLSYQGSVFSKIAFPSLFFQPEVLYSSLALEFESKNKNLKFSSHTSSLDLLCALGTSFFSFYKLYLAPSLSYLLHTKINPLHTPSLKTPKWATSLVIGIGAEFSFLTLDLRYQQAISTAENTFLFKGKNYAIQKRPSLLILSLGVLF